MRVSAETYYLKNLFGDFETIRMLAEAGFDCIDYSMDHMVLDDCRLNAPDYKEYAAKLRTYGESLGITFNQAHAPFEFDWEKEGVIEKEVIPTTVRCMEIASIMGIDTVIVHPLHYLNYFHYSETVWNQNIDFYTKLLPYAQKYNVRICLENLFQFDSRGVAVPDTCADAAKYVKALDLFSDTHIVACVDVGHVCLLGENPADLIRALGHARVKALHVHDNSQIVDDHTLPYLGNIDWEDVAKALADIDYDGVFTFESFAFYKNFPDDFLPTAAKWIHEMGVYLVEKIEKYKKEKQIKIV